MNALYPLSGGSGSVNLSTQSSCPWSLQSNAPWLTVSGNQSGMGSATIQYTAAPNTASGTAMLNVGGAFLYVNEQTLTPSNALNFLSIAPCRVADTRNANGEFGGPYLSANTSRSINIPASACNVPASAAAYSLNVTVVPHEPLGYLTAWPTGATQPLASTLNSGDGRVKANAAIIPAGTAGGVSFFATGDTDLVVDVNGYFIPSSMNQGLLFYPAVPCRVADTRNAAAPLGGPALAGSQSRTFPVLQSNCGISDSAQAYSLNVTAVPSDTALGYLSMWPNGQSQPLVSTLNAPTGAVTANAGILTAGSNGDIDVFASNPTNVVIDYNGVFSSGDPSGLHFYAVTPCRILDSRYFGAPPFMGSMVVMVAGTCNIPSVASAVVVNATVVPPGVLGYLSLWPDGQSQPLVSTLNSDGSVTSNMAIVPMGGGAIDAFASNPTHLVVDVTGYFAP